MSLLHQVSAPDSDSRPSLNLILRCDDVCDTEIKFTSIDRTAFQYPSVQQRDSWICQLIDKCSTCHERRPLQVQIDGWEQLAQFYVSLSLIGDAGNFAARYVQQRISVLLAEESMAAAIDAHEDQDTIANAVVDLYNIAYCHMDHPSPIQGDSLNWMTMHDLFTIYPQQMEELTERNLLPPMLVEIECKEDMEGLNQQLDRAYDHRTQLVQQLQQVDATIQSLETQQASAISWLNKLQQRTAVTVAASSSSKPTLTPTYMMNSFDNRVSASPIMPIQFSNNPMYRSNSSEIVDPIRSPSIFSESSSSYDPLDLHPESYSSIPIADLAPQGVAVISGGSVGVSLRARTPRPNSNSIWASVPTYSPSEKTLATERLRDQSRFVANAQYTGDVARHINGLNIAAAAVSYMTGPPMSAQKELILKEWLNRSDNCHPYGTATSNAHDTTAERAVLQLAFNGEGTSLSENEYKHIEKGLERIRANAAFLDANISQAFRKKYESIYENALSACRLMTESAAGTAASSAAASPLTRSSQSSSSTSYTTPTKKDGTLDMRYSVNNPLGSGGRGSSNDADATTSSASSFPTPSRYSSPISSAPLKKDGTPDMRYRVNNSQGYSSATVMND